jgi:hypothetical protein
MKNYEHKPLTRKRPPKKCDICTAKRRKRNRICLSCAVDREVVTLEEVLDEARQAPQVG